MESLSLQSNLQLSLNHRPRLTVDLPPTQREEVIKILMGRRKEQQYRLLRPQRLSLQDQHPLPSQAPLHPFPQHRLPQHTLDLLCQQQHPLEEMHRIRMGSIKDFYTEQLSNKH